MTTKTPRTSDEYGIILRDLLQYNHTQAGDVQAAIISSVVPNVMHSLTSAIIKYFHITPVIVAPGIRTGIRIATENPRQIGADRIVDAAPGIRTSAKALWDEAAKLPEIEICKPKSILAQETISSMQAGIVYGQIGQSEYIIRHIKEESGLKDVQVVATGGLGKLIASETTYIDIYDPNLTLQGMRLIYEKQSM